MFDAEEGRSKLEKLSERLSPRKDNDGFKTRRTDPVALATSMDESQKEADGAEREAEGTRSVRSAWLVVEGKQKRITFLLGIILVCWRRSEVC